MEEAITRLKLAADAGADVCFIEGVKTAELLTSTVNALAPKPVLVNVISGGLTPSFTCKEAEALGAKIISEFTLVTTELGVLCMSSLFSGILCRCGARYPCCHALAQKDWYRLHFRQRNGPQSIFRSHGYVSTRQ